MDFDIYIFYINQLFPNGQSSHDQTGISSSICLNSCLVAIGWIVSFVLSFNVFFILCNHCRNWTWVVEEILVCGNNRLCSTQCREFPYMKLCRPAYSVRIIFSPKNYFTPSHSKYRNNVVLFSFIKKKLLTNPT